MIKKVFAILFILFWFTLVAEDSLATDISFMVIDLKYNKEQGVKICEIQQLPISRLAGYKKLYGHKREVARKICDHIKRKVSDVWFIKNEIGDREIRAFFKEELIAATSMKDIINDDNFLVAAANYFSEETASRRYGGAIYVRPGNIASLKEFRKKYPGIIVIDAAQFPFWGNKYLMSLLFKKDPLLARIKPRWNAYQKNMPIGRLMRKIKRDIPSDRLVIKPIKASKGNGVIIAKADELENVLKRIFQGKDNELRDPSYDYWQKDKSPIFIVEEFVASGPVYLPDEDLPYDATIRCLCCLSYDNGAVDLEFPASYWKLPPKPSSGNFSLNEEHKSSGKVQYLPLSEDTRKNMEKILSLFLPELYLKMLRKATLLRNSPLSHCQRVF